MLLHSKYHDTTTMLKNDKLIQNFEMTRNKSGILKIASYNFKIQSPFSIAQILRQHDCTISERIQKA